MTLGGDYLSEESVLRSYPLYPTRKRRCCNVAGDGFTVISACFCIFTTALTIAFVAQLNYGSPEVTPHGAVSTDEEGCSRVGITIMADGGNAVDVAVASILCMTVVHPHAVGPGGSGVMLIHDHKTNSSTVVDFMSGVPYSHKAEEEQPSPTDGKSIGVPGLLRGLEYAHTKFGKLSWRKLFSPSIDIARKGFVVSAHLEEALKKSNVTQVDGVTEFDKTFFPRGIMLKQGDFMQRENYAQFLEIVAKHGADSFYALNFGVEEINALRENGAEIYVRDLDTYEPRERPCIHMSLKNMSVFTAPAPFGGPQLLAALQLLRNSNLTTHLPLSNFYHSFLEAIRRSYAGFVSLADAEEAVLQNMTNELLSASSEWKDDRVTLADPNIFRLPEQTASSVSVIDTFDSYVALVAGLGTYFGSRVMTKSGILFNNHLSNMPPHTHPGDEQFSHSRPLNTYTPVIITDVHQVCGMRAVLSSPDVGAVIQVISQLLFQGHSLTEAIEQPRITVRPGLDQVFVEDFGDIDRLPGSVRNAITTKNTLQVLHLPYPSVNGVSKTKDKLVSRSDARGGGVAHRLEPASTHTVNITTDL
ncbi:glutathione hydrolase 7-like isoform X2 [Penaeus japonicus]|uniref:glutathione hydrolase 7-like isoform X2 n=1 Tax=Penaeus japonicus TaxID=27405 RepID=UPI001C712457|nr:glutathione hydrolase 7-like isoform X2 [Penaeus japonicus]